MHEALCRSSGTTLDSVHAEDGPPITQRTSGLVTTIEASAKHHPDEVLFQDLFLALFERVEKIDETTELRLINEDRAVSRFQRSRRAIPTPAASQMTSSRIYWAR